MAKHFSQVQYAPKRSSLNNNGALYDICILLFMRYSKEIEEDYCRQINSLCVGREKLCSTARRFCLFERLKTGT